VWVASADGSIEYLNDAGANYLGVERDAKDPMRWTSLVHPADVTRTEQTCVDSARVESSFDLQCRLRRHDGAFRWHAVHVVPMRAFGGQVLSWIGTATDIEVERRLEESVARADQEMAETLSLLKALHSASPVGFGTIDREMRVVRLEGSLSAVDIGPVEHVLGRSLAEVVPDLWSQLEPIYRRVLRTGDTVVNVEVDGTLRFDPGHVHTWLASHYPVHLDDEIIGVGFVVVDVTESRRAEAFRTAVMDNMVEGLYALDRDGRVRFANESAVELLGFSEAELRGKSMHALVHYQRADGSPLPERESMLLRVCSEGRTIRMADDAFTRRDGTIVPVTYSAAPLLNGSQPDGAVVVFRDTTEERADEERVQRELDSLSWVGRIREAIDEDRLVLYSQPIVPLRGGEPTQELLVRMLGRGGEIILPGSFVPIAERYGMISEIDRWVVGQAARIAAQGRRVQANVSAQSIAPLYLLPLIEQELHDSGARASDLGFEITETALMKDVHAGEVFARGLADIGCGLSLDDFGTGFASFTYLKKLPLRSLKIDIEFVRDLDTNTANQHIVQSIIQLARGFGYETIAEGVEQQATLDLLRDYGADYAQGYLLGIPTPLRVP